MVFISKNDKDTWQEYVSNFDKLTFNFYKNSKNFHINKSNNNLIKKNETKSSFNLLKKGKIKPDGIIDLHGYKIKTGKIKLQSYILYAYEKNLRNILIITGKGHKNTGVLKKEVPIWLNENETKSYLVNFEIAPKNFGGEGALLVRIKNKQKNLI